MSKRGRFPFVGRTRELVAGVQLAMGTESDRSSRLLVLSGDSGTGKTFLCQEILRQCAQRDSTSVVLYFDIQADEFASSRLFESLVCLAWNEFAPREPNFVRIPKDASFSSYLAGKRIRSRVVNSLYKAVFASVQMLPGYGSAIQSILPSSIGDSDSKGESFDIASSLFEYVVALTQSRNVIVALDNYQFLPRHLRLIVETRLGAIQDGVTFVVINRTRIGASSIELPLLFPERRLEISLGRFAYVDTLHLFDTLFPTRTDNDRLARDCLLKSTGNLKEIELYVTALSAGGRASSRSTLGTLVETIGTLPAAERCLLALTTLFPSGLRVQHLDATISRLVATSSQEDLRQALHELVALGYLVINSRSGQLVRPAHEKIVTAMQSVLAEDEILDVRDAAVRAFDELLKSNIEDDHSYLLHCLVGVLNANEVVRRIDRLISLLDIQYQTDNFHYLVFVLRNPEMQEVLHHLPEYSICALLDSCQKACEFDLGISLVQRLRSASNCRAEVLDLNLAKYLAQLYKYDEALDILERLAPSLQTRLYQMGILLCMGQDERCREMFDSVWNDPSACRSIEAHIMLRNTAHLRATGPAEESLIRAFMFFRDKGMTFEMATSLNNLGVVYLWNCDLAGAERAFLQCHKEMSSLGSSEVYQVEVNLGVLDSVRGEYSAALDFFRNARRKTPPRLLLDQLSLESNIEFCRFATGERSGVELADALDDLYRTSLRIDDMRLQGQLALNAQWAVRKFHGVDSTAAEKARDFAAIRCRGTTGYEIDVRVTDIDSVQGAAPVWILFPYWRY